MRWAILVVIIGSLLIGCSSKIEREQTETTPGKIISVDEAVGSLPCFKCHSYQKFSAAPQKGVFSHQIHTNTGYHCNQCHEIKGHKHVAINTGICGNCHGINKMMTLKKTAMPSQFNHGMHSKIYSCKDCHPKVFLMSSGSVHVTMKDINNGAYCGVCHNGKKAFSSSDCGKCHKG